jgi:hypothetical protein
VFASAIPLPEKLSGELRQTHLICVVRLTAASDSHTLIALSVVQRMHCAASLTDSSLAQVGLGTPVQTQFDFVYGTKVRSGRKKGVKFLSSLCGIFVRRPCISK